MRMLLRSLLMSSLAVGLLFSPVSLARPGTAEPTPSSIADKLMVGSPASTPVGELTALEKYIAFDDGAFSWTLEKSEHVEAGVNGTWHALRMTSQRWRTKGEVDIPEWTHWVTVWVPDVLLFDKPILFIGGGRRKTEVPKAPASEVMMMAASGAIVVVVDNVPNQPLKLGNDPAERTEDGIVARTWVNAMRTGDATWIARFPMVKAAVKAMDAAEQFLEKHPQTQASFKGKPLDGTFKLGKYMVTGASKRGWTTWLTGAVDKRVGAIAPIVIDILDVPAQTAHHHDAYGFWSEALHDYMETGLTEMFQPSSGRMDPGLEAVLAHEDPIHWLSRVGDRPKYLVNATGDEFFLPDSSSLYEERLPQPWALRYEANAGHNLKDTPAAADLIGFYRVWSSGQQIPGITWESRAAGRGEAEIRVDVSRFPLKVTLWQATRPDRDFRFSKTGKVWKDSLVEPLPGNENEYIARIAAPESGFTAAFIEVQFSPAEGDVEAPLMTMTTRVYVIPDVMPHAKP